jgi:hypothetical protein
VRGKLRDKSATSKRDSIKRELVERRKPNKRDGRTVIWLNQESDSDDYELDLLEEEEEGITIPKKK